MKTSRTRHIKIRIATKDRCYYREIYLYVHNMSLYLQFIEDYVLRDNEEMLWISNA